MNRLRIVFLKKYDLKIHKSIFSNRTQYVLFLKRKILKVNLRF